MANGPPGQEMLFRAPAMVALMLDRRHDARLAVGPADGGDAGEIPEPRAGAVGGHQQPRREVPALPRLGRHRRRPGAKSP